jgi:nucleoside-diphosphate-sugar epimerase
MNISVNETDFYKQKNQLTHIIFGATSSKNINNIDFDNSLSYFNEALEISLASLNRPVFINLSSGAAKEFDFFHNDKTHLNRTYGYLKFLTENFVKELDRTGKILGCNPRLFNFYGPNFPIDGQYVISNFFKNSILREPINITSNPNSVRTYLYPIDLIFYLIKLLENPTINQIEIGGIKKYTINDLAIEFAEIFDNQICISENSTPVNIYAPDSAVNIVTREIIGLREGVIRWRDWYLNQS